MDEEGTSGSEVVAYEADGYWANRANLEGFRVHSVGKLTYVELEKLKDKLAQASSYLVGAVITETTEKKYKAVVRTEAITKAVDVLGMHAGDFRRGLHIPEGKYVCSVARYHVRDAIDMRLLATGASLSKCRVAKGVNFWFRLSVDPNVEGKTIECCFSLGYDDVWRLVKFLADCGIEDGIIGDRLKQTPGCQVGVKARRSPIYDDDGDIAGGYAEVFETYQPTALQFVAGEGLEGASSTPSAVMEQDDERGPCGHRYAARTEGPGGTGGRCGHGEGRVCSGGTEHCVGRADGPGGRAGANGHKAALISGMCGIDCGTGQMVSVNIT
jgi:hypothetical protein